MENLLKTIEQFLEFSDEKLEELYLELNKKKLEHERSILEKESQNTMHNALKLEETKKERGEHA